MELLKIDLTHIIRSRVKGIKGKLIPGFLLKSLERLIHQDELNAVLESTYPKEGTDFAVSAYEFFNTRLKVIGLENIPDNGRFIFASNHPLGGFDGIGLIATLGRKYGDDNIRFLVNDMLMNVAPLKSVFLPINKYGAQGREAAKVINEAYASDIQIIIFPAGLCSRLGDDGKIRDLKWNKSFVTKAIEYQRDIIPVRFIGENSPQFYNTARWRKRLHIGVNIEQVLLPGEVCKARDKEFTVIFSKPISWRKLKECGKSPELIAEAVKKLVYSLES